MVQPSACQPYRELILAKLDQGLTAQRIWQDLVSEHGFAARYHSVRRFVRKLAPSDLPLRRIECEPGAEAQVDFGTGAPVVIPPGQPLPVGVTNRRRRTHVLRIVLSHSRKAYSEVVYRQTTEEFIRVLENAFWHFGGVPRTLVIDNLKAAVAQADWFDPELNPKLQSFCRHYGTVILPTKPRMPRHNGKLERFHRTVKADGIRPGTPLSLADARRIVADFVAHYNTVRLHSAIQYITPADKLAGRGEAILAAREVKLAAAREARRARPQEARRSA